MALVSTSTKQILERATRCRASFEEFVRFVGGFAPAEHQRRWIAALQDLADNPTGARLLIIAPPGSGKTTIMILFMAWMIGRESTKHYGLLSYADAVGWSRSAAVKETLETKYYRYVFPEIRPGRKWGDTEFIVDRPQRGDPHPTLRAGGTNSSVIGARINGLLLDDPHDQKNSANLSQREKVYENYTKTLRTRLTSDAWVIVIGTRWADEDLIGRLLKQKGWKRIETPALRKQNGELVSYWPEHYPLEVEEGDGRESLLTKRYEMPALFALQYMHDTSGGETGIIRHVKCYYESPIIRVGESATWVPNKQFIEKLDLVTASAWDTAFKKGQDNDFSVQYIGGLGKDGRIYVLDRVKDRMSLPEIMESTNDKYIEWGLSGIYFEDTASGTPAVQTLMVEMPHLPTVAVAASSGGKTPRAHALAPYLHGGHVLFPAYADWLEDARYNLTFYPYTDHDDDLDALWILVSNLLAITHPSMIYNRPEVRIQVG